MDYQEDGNVQHNESCAFELVDISVHGTFRAVRASEILDLLICLLYTWNSYGFILDEFCEISLLWGWRRIGPVNLRGCSERRVAEVSADDFYFVSWVADERHSCNEGFWLRSSWDLTSTKQFLGQR